MSVGGRFPPSPRVSFRGGSKRNDARWESTDTEDDDTADCCVSDDCDCMDRVESCFGGNGILVGTDRIDSCCGDLTGPWTGDIGYGGLGTLATLVLGTFD